MAGALNKVQLIGNLGADPEIKDLRDGRQVCNLRIATTESWKDKQSGEKREKTEWHSVVIWNEGLVGIAEKWLKKGSKVYIEGQLQTRKWQDQAGNDRYTTEVVLQNFGGAIILLGDPGGRNGGDDDETPKRGAKQSKQTSMDLEDEIPF